MAKPFQAIRGMNDILPAESARWQALETTAREVLAAYSYQEIRLPLVEKTELFARSIGEVTDIVEKEMYTFDDRNGESLTLRPEGTAGCVRAGIEHGLLHHQTQRLWYIGPMFRYEKPQKGRYRQFHQIDAEIIGAGEPQADVELLAMADQLLKELGITGVTLHLNTLGDVASREAWRAALIEYFHGVKGELSEESQERLEKNPLRILDSKDARDQRFVADAPKIDAYLSDEARAFFDAVTSGLDAAGVKWVRAESLVRGLDYYRHTAFEFIPDAGSEAASKLGSQSTILGGGRYDGLMESLGGAATPAVGWAAGIERLAMLVGEKDEVPADVIIVVEDDSRLAEAVSALRQLRDEGLTGEMIANGSPRKRYDKAVKKTPCAIVSFKADAHSINVDGQASQRLQDFLKRY